MALVVVALLVGTLTRVAALPLAGTTDVPVFKGWSYNAATRSVSRLYDWAGTLHDRTLRRFEGFNAQGDYPPLIPVELGVAGRVYRWASAGAYPDTPALTAAVKMVPLVADAGIALLLFLVIRRTHDMFTAAWFAIGYWLNPAMILVTAVLGYMDTLFLLPAMGALVAAIAGWPATAGGLMAAAALTKPQAVFLVPAVGLAIWNASAPARARRIGAVAAGFVLTSAAILATTLESATTVINMVLAVGAAAFDMDVLSANTCNLWWVAGHVARVMDTLSSAGVWAALTLRAEIVSMSDVGAGPLVLRFLGLVLTLAIASWAVWTARRAADLWLLAGVAAFLAHAHVVVAVPVHENRLYAAAPLLILAAAGRRRFLPLAVAVSAIFALNLLLFYGLGEGVGYRLPRTWTIVDATVWLAVANCLALVWHAAILRQACASPAPGEVTVPLAASRAATRRKDHPVLR